ncbi:hypothetical protein [Candidatus Stoquefichus sp. SB1]|uniref:hypothetical protein n=1 Tax=Candidatus Stoquefichus sp. SB1 TaxID=1658109 RepID=UPI00067EF379|nr:hypothetical protein [Candidatus Stoquefichus sp. SB1]
MMDEEKSGKEILEFMDKYLNADNYLAYCNLKRDREVIESKRFQAKKKAIEEGKKIGIAEEKRKDCLKIIKGKYPDSSLEWLNTCTMEQLDKVFELIFQDISYEEFKTQVLNNSKNSQ